MLRHRLTSLRAKVLAIVGVVVLLLAVAARTYLVHRSDHIILSASVRAFQVFEKVFAAQFQEKVSDLSMSLEVLLQNPQVTAAVAVRDREALIALCQDEFDSSLKPRFGIRQLHFHDSNSNSLFRAHLPREYGDDLSAYRQTVVRANAEVKPVAGLEVGYGGPGLRVVYPVFHEDRHVGSVELGESLPEMFGSGTRATGLEFALGIRTAVIESLAYYPSADDPVLLDGMRYDHFSSSLMKTVARENGRARGEAVQLGSLRVVVDAFPLNDFAGNDVGRVLLAKDISGVTDQVSVAAARETLLIVGFGLVLIGLLYLVLHFALVQPMRYATLVSEQISRGDLNVQIGGKGRGEVGRLFDNLQTMMDNFKRSVESQRRAEEEKVQLGTAAEQMAEALVITDRQGSVTYVNPAFETITGYGRDEILGHSPSVLKSGQHDAGFYRDLWDTILAGEVWRGHFRNRKKGGAVYDEDAVISPVRDETGQIVSFVAVKRDVTDLRRLEAQLRQARKLEAIGTLAGGIAHDFNNILSAILGYAELAERHTGDGKTRDCLRQVIAAAERAGQLVRQILTFARTSEQEPQPVQAAPLVKEVLKMLRASLPTTIEVRSDIASDGQVLCDPGWIHQIVMNLCTNAGHAMPAGGVLEVQLAETELDEEFASQHLDARPGRHLRLTVRDTGSGMPPEVVERIFDPFFTTKEPGEGTGLGLSVVHGIVEKCGGTITVYSEPGTGSVFHVFLPIAGAPPNHAAAVEPIDVRGTERILFVDDEVSQAELARSVLGSLGYNVTATSESPEALEWFRANPHAYDLVVTDMTMPVLTGDALAEAILATRPDTPIILCTGYSPRITGKDALDKGIRAFVMKPVSMTQLAKTIREVLDAGG